MSEQRTPEEMLAHEKQMVRQAGEALVTTGHLILTAVTLDNWALLDWPELLGFVNEQVKWAAQEGGFVEEDGKP